MDFCQKIIKSQVYDLTRLGNYSVDRDKCLCLDKNERLFSFDDEFIENIKEKISSNLISTYFDLESTYNKLSDFTGSPVSNLLLSAGADAGIKYIYDACIAKGDNIILPSLSYAMYRVYAIMSAAEIEVLRINITWNFSIDKIFKHIKQNTKMIILESPNGTVGSIYEKEEIEECAKILFDKNILLLVDETYWGVDERYKSVKDVVNKYYEAFPKVKQWLEDASRSALEEGYADTFSGRRRYFDVEGSQGDRSKISTIERQGRNFKIQATNADWTKRSLYRIRQEILSRKLKAQIVSTVHDEIVVECAEGIAPEMKEIVVDCMVESGQAYLKTVPVEVDAKIADYWSK